LQAAIRDGSWRQFLDELDGRREACVVMSELAELYVEHYAKANNRTTETKRSRIRVLMKEFADLPINQMATFEITRYITRRRREAANTTINKDLALLRHMLEWAKRQGLVERNILKDFQRLPEVKKLPPDNLEEAIKAVLRKLSPSLRPLLDFIYETGCRKGEALSLKHNQVLFDESLVLLTSTKSGLPRYLILTQKAIEAVRALPRVCEWVFYNPQTLKPWQDFQQPWQRARSEAGYPKLKVKDLRTAFAMRLADMEGIEKHVIQTVLGHSNLSTTEQFYAFHSQKKAVKRALTLIEGGKAKRGVA
jgi:integrase